MEQFIINRRQFVGAAATTLALGGVGTGAMSLAGRAGTAIADETAAPVTTVDQVHSFLEAVDESYARSVVETLSSDSALLSNAMGFRTAASDAEHAAANWIAEEMGRIGIADVELIPVTVDKWEFKGASLAIEGTDIDLMPASYAQTGTPAEGITAQIVDLGTGFAADYEGVDIAGKIALVGVDQKNESWIDGYIYEAYDHGVAALVTYDLDGYGRCSDDALNIQDVCCEDLLPTAIISYNQYLELAAAIANGHDVCTLVIDSVVEPGGTSYNVAGRIHGKSSEQQIIISGHYDLYFKAAQDDSSAVALAMAVGKAMIDAGYQPENDIVILAHGSEEWGTVGAEFDWSAGAWELINHARPEWAQKTIAVLNFELCAFASGATSTAFSCVPEFATLVADLVNGGEVFAGCVEGAFPDGISPVTYDSTTMEDGISYRGAGVPYFINVTDVCASEAAPEGEYSWSEKYYHTQFDNMDTYDAAVMDANIRMYGALAVYLDQTPALQLDFTCTCDDMEEALDTDCAEAADVDVAAYQAAIADFRAAAEAHAAAVQAVNDAYNQAVSAGADAQEIEAIRAQGRELNQKTLAAFKMVQDGLIGIIFSSDVVVKHVGYQLNAQLIAGVCAAIEDGNFADEEGTGATDLAWMINGVREYNFYIFGEFCGTRGMRRTDAAQDAVRNWGIGKAYILAQTWPATTSMLAKLYDEGEGADFSEELGIYQAELLSQLELMGEVYAQETQAMTDLAAYLNA